MRPRCSESGAAILVVLAVLTGAGWAHAQDASAPLAWELGRKVLADPTTYAPALFTYEAMSADWTTSQVLFARGWVEANPRFTQSGRPNDAPLSYAAGQARIRQDALNILVLSALNNLGAGVAERWLIERYPSRRRLIQVLSWAERVGYAAVVAYQQSGHLRQARANRRLARELGFLPP